MAKAGVSLDHLGMAILIEEVWLSLEIKLKERSTVTPAKIFISSTRIMLLGLVECSAVIS